MTMPDDYKNDIVLIVDDTPQNIALISSFLIGLYRIKVATTGEKALQIAASDDQPDLILLDIMMPEMDGYETCINLKSNPRTRDIPIIFLTAKAQVKDEQKQELKQVQSVWKEVTCPDCQGTGWLLFANVLRSSAVSGPFTQARNDASNASKTIEISKMVCPYCGGKRTIWKLVNIN